MDSVEALIVRVKVVVGEVETVIVKVVGVVEVAERLRWWSLLGLDLVVVKVEVVVVGMR